jgi:hypothetical protein
VQHGEIMVIFYEQKIIFPSLKMTLTGALWWAKRDIS